MTPDSGTPPGSTAALQPRIKWLSSPVTMEDHLAGIGELSERILGHVRFISAVGELGGTSGEAKQRAVASFYACLTTMERALSRIGNDLRLG
jgi:hypothetical protein